MSDLKDALERAKEYRSNKEEEQKLAGKESTTELAGSKMQEWRDVVSQRIEEAMSEGHFDNLRNKGKPLNLERNPFVPADMEMAYHILENNDLPPGWITERTSLLSTIETFRAKLRNAKGNLDNPQWREEMRTLNKRIESVNIAQPFAHLEIYKLVWEDEVARAKLRLQ